MKARKPLLLAALALALLALAGCGESTPEVSEIVTTTSTTAATATAQSTTTIHPRYEDPRPGETPLENGHLGGLGYIAMIHGVYARNAIFVAYVEILTGEEAKAAAIEDGELQPGEDLPNDYYVRKTAEIPEGVTTELERWKTPKRLVSPNVVITVFTWGEEGEQTITWEQFLSFFGKYGQTPPRR